jgi:hypothetical protein
MHEVELSIPETVTPEYVHAEHAAMQLDPAHPLHVPFLKGHPATVAYLDKLYRAAYPGNAKVTFGGPGVTITTPLDGGRDHD